MITLALQIFLLLLSAYLAGCMAGCMLRRSLHTPKVATVGLPAETAVLPEPLPRRVPTPESVRFEQALTGKTTALQPDVPFGEPVVEVRARPAPERYAGTNGTADIEIVKPTLAPLPEEIATADVQPEPDTPVETVAVEPAAVETAQSEPEPVAESEFVEPEEPSAPEPVAAPTPIMPVGAAQVASYAAIAAAAAAARAVAEAEAALQAEAEAAAEPEAESIAEPSDDISDAPEAEADPVAVEPEQTAIPAEPEPAPAEEAAEAAAPLDAVPARQVASPDDLKRIRGIDAELQDRLNGLGVFRFVDIAAWGGSDVQRIGDALGLAGRIEQENWIEQAQILAKGSETDYARRQRVAAATAGVGVAAAAASAAANATAQKSAGPDRFTRIIGIDPETEQTLYGLGVSRYSEIAQWSSADVERVEAVIGRPGRVGLDNWIEQARVLARYAGEAIEPRPVRLADAIRDNRGAKPAESAAPQRADVSALRSVRSQALRGEAPHSGGRVDDLKRIRGVGVLIEKRLNSMGISSYEQIANWTKADIDSISLQLDFRGRIERENWIEQARILASGGQTEFSRRVDRGEVDSSKDG